MKKLPLFLLSVATAVCMIFSACGQPQTPPEEPSTNPPEPPPETSITFSEFIQNHKNKAVEYYNDSFSDITSGKELLAETVSIGANSNDELNTVTAVYTYKVDDTHRKIEKVKATLSSPVDLDKIVDGTAGSVTYTPQIEEILLFDIQFIKENAELTEKLFSTAELNSDVKIYGEVESIYSNTRSFHLLTYDGAAYTVGEISVIVDNDFSQEKLFENLQKPSKVEDYAVVKICTFKEEGQETIISSDYDFAADTYTPTPVEPENPDQGGEGEEGEGGGETEETIGSIAELIQNYNDEVYAALNDAFLLKAGRKIYDQTFKAEKVVEKYWDIGNEDIIKEIKLITTYESEPGNYVYGIGTIELANVINVNVISKDEIVKAITNSLTGATYTKDYTFGYTDSIQGTRNDLVNAIFAACGHELTDESTRLFIDNGYRVNEDIGESHQFRVAEIKDNGIYEYAIEIKESSSDNGYIQNIEKNNFRILSQQSQTFSGNFVTKTEQKKILQPPQILYNLINYVTFYKFATSKSTVS